MTVSVLGAGGHAKVVIATLQAAGHEVRAVYDDAPDTHGTAVLGVPVLGSTVQASGRVVVAVGANAIRQRVVMGLGHQVEWVAAIHPNAIVHPSACIGPGAVVFAGAVVQPNGIVGAHAIINTGASVDHDTEVGAFAHVAPGVRLAGGVRLGEGAFVGIGASAVPGVSIGAWATVGAGAVVIQDVLGGQTVVGVPARPLDP
ncbi:MAG: acetyltransferase [Bacteroidota bacterium]